MHVNFPQGKFHFLEQGIQTFSSINPSSNPCSTQPYFWVAVVESRTSLWAGSLLILFILTFDHMNIISFDSLPPPLNLDHWN